MRKNGRSKNPEKQNHLVHYPDWIERADADVTAC